MEFLRICSKQHKKCVSDSEDSLKLTITVENKTRVHNANKFKHSKDLCLDNLNSASAIDKEEFVYRMAFYMGIDERDPTRPAILQCRLHCTVCDCHLSSAGPDILSRARMHSSLAVLVCNACYALTDANPQTFVGVCQWCFKVDGIHFLCSTCPAKCCEDCLKRNFGDSWSNMIAQKKAWMCLLCDVRQLWPHRAVAYLLLRYYLKLKEQNNVASSTDMTSCCKPFSSENGFLPVLTLPGLLSPNPSLSLAKLAEFVKSHQTVHTREQTILKLNQVVNPFLKSSKKTSALSLNTDMQYVDNYVAGCHLPLVSCQNLSTFDMPLVTYVVPTAAVPPQSATSMTPSRDVLVYKQTSGNRISLATPPVQCIITPRIVSIEQNMTKVSQVLHPTPSMAGKQKSQTFPENQNMTKRTVTQLNVEENLTERPIVQASSINHNLTVRQNLTQTPFPQNLENHIMKKPTLQELSTELNIAERPVSHSFSADYNIANEHKLQTFSANQDLSRRPMPLQRLVDGIVPRGTMLGGSSTDNMIETAMPNNLLADQLVDTRPMPKSKRALLLKNALISSGIDTIEDFTDKIGGNDICSTLHVNLSEASRINHLSEGFTSQPINVEIGEEPILKSIVDSATESIINLHKKHGSFNVNDESIRTNFLKACSEKKSYCQQVLHCKPETEAPKIKIRAVKELQGCREERADDYLNDVQDDHDNTSSEVALRTDEPLREVNVGGLKQGIIDASRILVNTQKRFKELAKIISSTSLFKRCYATKLLNQFEDIIKSCQRDMDLINKSIKSEFSDFRYSTNMDIILNSIKKATSKEKKVDHEAVKCIMKKAQLRRGKKDQDSVLITDVRSLADHKIETQKTVKSSSLIPLTHNETTLYETETRLLLKSRNIEDLENKVKDCFRTVELSEDHVSIDDYSNKDKHQVRKDLEMRKLFLNQKRRKTRISSNERRKNQETDVQCQVKQKQGRPPASKKKKLSPGLSQSLNIWQNPVKKENNNCDLDSDDSIILENELGRANKFDSDLSESEFSPVSISTPERKRLYRRTKLPRTPLRFTRNNLNTSLKFGTFINTVKITDESVIPFPKNFIIKPCSVVLERLSLDIVQTVYN